MSEEKTTVDTKVVVVQKRGVTGRTERTKDTLRALGLGRIGKSREHVLSPSVAGMLKKVRHLVEIKPVK